MKFSVINLGCKVNKAESDSIAADFLSKGHHAASVQDADLIVVNTCTVTGDAEKKTRKAVRRALRENQQAEVLVTGCAAVIDPDFYQDLSPRVKIISKADILSATPALRIGEGFPQRVSVKIQDGCNHACTYCIVHVARGKAWSRPLEEVLQEIKALERAGIHEIMLTGIDLGSYYECGNRLPDLLERLLSETTEMRFRVSSIEPRSISERTIELLAESEGRICRHLHVPLQSGSSKVLQEMNRPYDASYFDELVSELYKAVPELSLSTDIIAGFPGETESELNETLELARRARFSKIHAFRYSERAGTPAAERTDQIDPSIKEKRLQRLLTLADEMRFDEARKRIGKKELVLVEQPGIGMSESYYKVEVPQDIPVGSLVPLTFTGVDSSCIMTV